MKLKNYSLLALGTIVFLASCSKDGDNGKDSLTRTTKEAAGSNCPYGGTKLETGLDLNGNGTLDDNEVTSTQTRYLCDGATVTYSNWIDVNVQDNTDTLIAPNEFGYIQYLPATAITADIVNKGVVLLYYKDKQGVVTPVERDDVYEIYDYDAQGYYFYFSAGYVYKKNYLAFLVSDDFDKSEINDNGSAVRYVLIPGGVQGRSVADLKKMPYSEVAKLYNIKD